ncbi:MAG: hypothetical protein ACPGUV_00845 [Polyangiales bacterium]
MSRLSSPPTLEPQMDRWQPLKALPAAEWAYALGLCHALIDRLRVCGGQVAAVQWRDAHEWLEDEQAISLADMRGQHLALRIGDLTLLLLSDAAGVVRTWPLSTDDVSAALADVDAALRSLGASETLPRAVSAAVAQGNAGGALQAIEAMLRNTHGMLQGVLCGTESCGPIVFDVSHFALLTQITLPTRAGETERRITLGLTLTTESPQGPGYFVSVQPDASAGTAGAETAAPQSNHPYFLPLAAVTHPREGGQQAAVVRSFLLGALDQAHRQLRRPWRARA